jgi:hypothetical protein
LFLNTEKRKRKGGREGGRKGGREGGKEGGREGHSEQDNYPKGRELFHSWS